MANNYVFNPAGLNTSDQKYKIIASASTNGQLITIGPCHLTGGILRNKNTTTDYYLKLYDLARLAVIGTDPSTELIPLPYNGIVDLAAVFSNYGSKYFNGVAMAITLNPIDSDTNPVANAGDVVGTIKYIY